MNTETTTAGMTALPTTTEALDAFVAEIITTYELPPGDDTYDAIATMVLHLPHTTAFKEMSYFANGVKKAMANLAAYTRLSELKLKREAAEKAKAEEANKLEDTKKAALTLVNDNVEPLQGA